MTRAGHETLADADDMVRAETFDTDGHPNIRDAQRTSDVPSIAFDEKPEKQPSLSSRDSIRSDAHEEVVQEKRERDESRDDVEHASVEQDEERELEPVKSKQPSVHNVSSIPDGGLWAWLQVLGAFFLFFNSW